MNRLKFLSVILAVLLVLPLLPAGMLSASAETMSQITYLNENGVSATYTGSVTVVDDTTTAMTDGWYAVTSDVTVAERIIVSGTVSLVLCDGATLTSDAGITVPTDATFKIFAQSTGDSMGALTATATAVNFAGIGGDNVSTSITSGMVEIYGGVVTATGANNAAGIGGGANGAANVLIAGGNVTALGGSYGAGIGTGNNTGYSPVNNITITGGTVFADGVSGYGAGIGGGEYSGGGNITITGGNITAIGHTDSAGIGGCDGYRGGNITISGGVISATPGEKSAAIGGGGYWSSSPYGGTAGTIVITGGQITTVSSSYAQIGIGDSYATQSGESNVTIALQSTDDFINSLGVKTSNLTVEGMHTIEIEGAPISVLDEDNVLSKGIIRLFTGTAYTVSFVDSNGTTLISEEQVPAGSTAHFPDIVPMKKGYTFNCWKLGSAEYDFSAPVTSDLTIKASYTANASISYVGEDGAAVETNQYKTIFTQNDPLTLSSGLYTTADGATLNKRVFVNGDVSLILKNNTTLTANSGIILAPGSSLKIFAQVTGEEDTVGALVAKADEYNIPGIGWVEQPQQGSVISIYGGSVNVTGKDYAAGIGGGKNCFGNVVINGGVVTVNGGRYAAGIGSGYYGAASSVTINGGTVTANGGEMAAGIGGGYNSVGNVTINGGVVDVSSGTNSNSAIGCGYDGKAGSTVVIRGGQVSSRRGGVGGYSSNDNVSVVKLGYTDAENDFIKFPAYYGKIVFLNSFKIDGSDPMEIATVDNIANNKLVASGLPNYSVTLLDEDGTTVIETISVIPESTIVEIDAPDKTAQFKVFTGWKLNGEAFDFTTAITEDITLVASYVAVPKPAGNGTASDPLLIASTDDWNMLADMVNVYGFTLEGLFVKLTKNITVSTMVGDKENNKPFSGTFTGNGKTLTLDLNGTVMGAAPFNYVKNATIKTLKTDGTVISNQYHASGLIGYADGVTIINCVVSADIKFATNMTSVFSGGFIGHALSAPFTMNACVFDGSIVYDGTSSNTMQNVGGLVGWDDNSTPTITNCLNLGTFQNATHISKIARVYGRGTITNCYATVNNVYNYDNHHDFRGAYAYGISAGAYVNVAPAGETTAYGVSGITVAQTGLFYQGVYYLGAGETVGLNLTYTGDLPEGVSAIFEASAGTLRYDGSYSITMPSENVTITASTGMVFDIVLNAGNGGSLSVINTRVEDGTTVQFDVSTEDNYVLDAITVKKGTNTIELTKFNRYAYSFVMPAGDVTVTATFKEVTMSGDGTAENPYEITNGDQWALFVNKVNKGQTNACAILKNNIFADCMVGTETNKYAGTFNGNGKKVTITLASNGEYTAPFRYVNGATIKFLTVDGTITATEKYCAGLIGDARSTNVICCRSSVTIDSSVVGEGAHAGFAATVSGGRTEFRNCLFDGSLLGESTTSCAGFVGSRLYDYINFYNCYFNATWTIGTSNSATFYRNTSTSCYIVNSWYNNYFGASQGDSGNGKTAEEMLELLGNAWTVSDGAVVPATANTELTHATVENYLNRARYTGSVIELPSFTVKALDGTVLVKDTDYTVSVSPVTIKEIGTYTVTVSAIGQYSGAFTIPFYVTQYDVNLVYDENLFGEEQGGWYIVMPANGTLEVLLDNIPSDLVFYVYDCGGKNGDYSNNSDGTLILHGPEDVVLKIEGTGNTENNFDYLYVYDSDQSTVLCKKVMGSSFSFGPVYTSASDAKFTFHSDGSAIYNGFEAKVTVLSLDTEYDIVINNDEFGSITGPATAKKNDSVTLTVSPASGYVLCRTSIVTVTGNEVEYTLSGNRIIFTMTAGAVTVTPEFQTVAFTRDLANSTIEYEKTYVYTGEVIAPTLVVKNYIGDTLTENTDYTISIAPSVVKTPGVYVVTVTGKGIYTGSKTVKIGVTPDSDIAFDGEEFYVNIIDDRTIDIDLSAAPANFSFVIYDDGGKLGNYANNVDGIVNIHAPEGYTFGFSGDGSTESTYDRLYILDADGTPLGGNYTSSNVLCYSTTSFEFEDLETTANGGTIKFHSDGSNIYYGFAVTVTMNSGAISGDLNNDESVDVNDVTALLNYIAGNSSADFSTIGDLNKDGDVDVNDVTTLLNILGGRE